MMAEMRRRRYSQWLYGFENTAWNMNQRRLLLSMPETPNMTPRFPKIAAANLLCQGSSALWFCHSHTGTVCHSSPCNLDRPHDYLAQYNVAKWTLCRFVLPLAQQSSLFSLGSQARVRSVTILRPPVVGRPSLVERPMEEARLCGEREGGLEQWGARCVSNEATVDSSLVEPSRDSNPSCYLSETDERPLGRTAPLTWVNPQDRGTV